MYTPAAFAEPNLSRLHDIIEQHSFGLLVSQIDQLPFATHLPFLLDRAGGPHGTLVSHLARANPQWREIANQTALAIFSGPHAYISPTWYDAKQVVPTWNYVAVHAYGCVEVIEDGAALLEVLQQTVRLYEQAMPQPWSFDPSSDFVQRLLPQIVGLRLRIDKIEGKSKLNQNHPLERRSKVIRALRDRGDENALAVAAIMQESLDERGVSTPRSPVMRVTPCGVFGSPPCGTRSDGSPPARRCSPPRSAPYRP